MELIAIVTPLILPVPVATGGAIEGLITEIIKENEKKPTYYFHVYTLQNVQNEQYNYQYTRIIPVRPGKFTIFLDKCLDKMFRILNVNYSFRMCDTCVSKIIAQLHYDSIIVENMGSMYRKIRRKSNGSPIIFHMHNNIDMYRTINDLKKVNKDGNKVFVVSRYLQGEIRKRVPNLQCYVLYNGVDISKYRPYSQLEKDVIRKEMNIPKDMYVFAFFGRIIPEKGVYELIKAFNHFKEYNKNCILLIIGKPQFEKNKQTLYSKLVFKAIDNNQDIKAEGFIMPSDVPKVYACVDSVVIPSIWEEPFGMVALEALCMGKPIVASKCGGLVEILNDSCACMVDCNERFVDNLFHGMMEIYDKSKMEVNSLSEGYLSKQHLFSTYSYFERFCELMVR